MGVVRGWKKWLAAGLGAALALALLSAGAEGASFPPATLSFRSAPGLHPPAVAFGRNPDRSSGDIFLTPLHSYQTGPMILSSRGQLLWFGWNGSSETANLQVQRYQGQPVLTWWQRGPDNLREDVIMDSSYRTVAVLHGGDGYVPDSHEFQITPQGTALISTPANVKADLSSVGGPSNGRAVDPIIEELDIATGQVLWQWHGLGHVPLSASYLAPPQDGSPYNYFHMNSIQQLPDGDLLVSARNTWAVYLISKQTGQVIWTLGGKNSSFKMGPGTNFEWQHDARLCGNRLTLFDDAWGSSGTRPSEPQSSAKALELNTSSMTATLLHVYDHSPSLLAGVEGGAQTLPNGNVFVGWGSQPDFSEYTPNGQQIFNGNLPLGVKSYRAYRFPWSGQPLTPPLLATVRRPDGSLIVYASWNGATQVATWQVLGGSGPSSLVPLATKTWRSFQTAIHLATRPAYVAVQALDQGGHVLGTSAPRAT